MDNTLLIVRRVRHAMLTYSQLGTVLIIGSITNSIKIFILYIK